MFTGIVEEVGKIINLEKNTISIKCSKVVEGTAEGDSICVSGVCLTVVKVAENRLTFNIGEETLKRTSLKLLKPGDYVNLERALKLSDRLGGHILLGHTDTTTRLKYTKRHSGGTLLVFQMPSESKPYIADKGSIGIDGISLTVSGVDNASFSVFIIPHTFKNTTVKFLKPGSVVNIEYDIFARYTVNAIKNAAYILK